MKEKITTEFVKTKRCKDCKKLIKIIGTKTTDLTNNTVTVNYTDRILCDKCKENWLKGLEGAEQLAR